MTGKRIIGTLGPYPWIAVVAIHLDHPKVDALVHELGGDRRAALHVSAVWGFYSQKYPDGDMPDALPAVEALERWARWQGDLGGLVAAMVKVGLLTRSRKRIKVHDWAIYQEAHAERRAKDRAYQVRRRAELKGKSRPDIGTTTAGVSTSPCSSPSPCSLASEGNGEQHGNFPANPKPSPTPFWHDHVWGDRIKRPLPSGQRAAFDTAVSQEAQPIFALRQGSPDWVGAEAEGRRRLEAAWGSR
jgi:hypothetical protein